MTRAVGIAVLLVWFACGPTVLAADADPVLTIPWAIEQLGSDEFHAREAAAAFLWAAGDDALPHLEEASRSADSLMRSRATKILERIRHGILPTTPPEVAEQIHVFRTGDRQARKQVVERLLELDQHRAIARLLLVESDLDAYRTLVHLVSRHPAWNLHSLLIERNDELVEAILHERLAVYATIRGRLPECVARIRRAAAKDPQGVQLMKVSDLERAIGHRLAPERHKDAPGPLAIQVKNREWAKAAVMEWKLAQEEDEDDIEDVESVSHLAFLCQRAGMEKEFHDAVEQLQQLPVDLDADIDRHVAGHHLTVAQGLLALEQFDDATRLLAVYEPGDFVSLAARRGDFAAALALAKCDGPTTFDDAWFESLPVADAMTDDRKFAARRSLACATMAVLSQVGRRSDAHAVLRVLMAQPAPVKWTAGHHATLANAAIREGFVADAHTLACRSLAADNEGYHPIWGELFDEHSEIAREWYAVLQCRARRMEIPDAVELVWRLARPGPENTVPAEELTELVKEALETLDACDGRTRRSRITTIVDTCLLHGKAALAREVLENDVVPHDEYRLLRLGDLALQSGDKATARDWYTKAWQLAPASAVGKPWQETGEKEEEFKARAAHNGRHREGVLALYLRGVLTAGAEGEHDKETALLLSIDDPHNGELYAIAGALAERGLVEEAQPIWELIVRTMDGAWVYSDAAQKLGDAIAAVDPIRASYLWDECVYLEVLPISGGFREATGYLEFPFVIHKVRGRGLLEAGKVDDAWREFEACQRILPGDPGLIEAMVRRLEAVGAHDKAESLFRAGYGRARDLSEEWPKAAQLHNNAAWMAACCHRELDDALHRATKAVELDPTNAAYLDTLAEVHFHRGDRVAAVELSRQAVALAPNDKNLATRLARFEKEPFPIGSQKTR